MRLLRGIGGSLLWILAGLLGLVGVLLSVTIILLPLGIPVLLISRKLFKYSMVLFVPRKVRHPVQELGTSAKDRVKQATDSVSGSTVDMKSVKKAGKNARKSSGSFVKSLRKRFA